MSESESANHNLNVHEKALTRATERNSGGTDPRIAQRFEEARLVAHGSLGPSPQRDASLNWAGGQHHATEAGPGDRPLSVALANTAGVGSTAGMEQSNSRAPSSNVRPVPNSVGAARFGVASIVGGE
jgi:hypothetical protein